MADKSLKTKEPSCIRVLHFVSTLSQGSGVMSVIMNYYRYIDREKVQFDFLHFLSCKDSYKKEIEELGGKVFYVDKPKMSLNSLKELSSFFRIHARDYCWLHNHEIYLSFLLRPLSQKYGLEKFIIHVHATRYSDNQWNAIRNRLLCFPIRFMRVEMFACSVAAGCFLFGKRKMESGKVFIMHNAIDCDGFRFQPELRTRLRKEMGLEGKLVIGHVGRLERQKNHKFMIEVFKEVKRKLPESVLLLVGEGSLEQTVRCQVNHLKLENDIFFLGQRYDVASLLNAIDIFILPSFYEGLPVSCIEASSNGLPCIISQDITSELLELPNVFAKDILFKDQWVDEILRLSKNLMRFNYYKLTKYDIKYQSSQVCQKYIN